MATGKKKDGLPKAEGSPDLFQALSSRTLRDWSAGGEARRRGGKQDIAGRYCRAPVSGRGETYFGGTWGIVPWRIPA